LFLIVLPINSGLDLDFYGEIDGSINLVSLTLVLSIDLI
jgi:hypothetical protein